MYVRAGVDVPSSQSIEDESTPLSNFLGMFLTGYFRVGPILNICTSAYE